MKKYAKPLRFALALLPVALAAGWFTAQYSLDALSGAMMEEMIRQAGSPEAARTITVAVTVAQTVLYALVCGFFGYVLAEKLGLMRPFRPEKRETVLTAVLGVLCGGVFSLDAWTFTRWIPELAEAYAGMGRFDAPAWIASVLYGGVVEEVMLRLFLMSLLAWLGWKLFFRRMETVPAGLLIAANGLAALAFAALHLPATALDFGKLTPLLLLRCFLLNGAFGLAAGRLYRKYGIQYAMLFHTLLHIVSRTVWLIALP